MIILFIIIFFNFFKNLYRIIGNKIKTMELMCKDLSKLDKNNNESVNYCLENLHDMIIRIREDLKPLSRAQ